MSHFWRNHQTSFLCRQSGFLSHSVSVWKWVWVVVCLDMHFSFSWQKIQLTFVSTCWWSKSKIVLCWTNQAQISHQVQLWQYYQYISSYSFCDICSNSRQVALALAVVLIQLAMRLTQLCSYQNVYSFWRDVMACKASVDLPRSLSLSISYSFLVWCVYLIFVWVCVLSYTVSSLSDKPAIQFGFSLESSVCVCVSI